MNIVRLNVLRLTWRLYKEPVNLELHYEILECAYACIALDIGIEIGMCNVHLPSKTNILRKMRLVPKADHIIKQPCHTIEQTKISNVYLDRSQNSFICSLFASCLCNENH